MPIPKTPKKVKSFVCAMLYYRKFIPKFAELAKQLMDLSALHPTQFKWLPLHQQSFDRMIKAIETNTSLNLPDPKKPFLFKQTLQMLQVRVECFRKTTKVMNYLWPVFHELLLKPNANMAHLEKKS